jgi:cysteine synthase A
MSKADLLTKPLIANDISELIGRTPMVRLNRMNNTEATILLKLESENPLASVKDRLVVSVIRNAEKEGTIKPGFTLIEATSGNTGIALAQLGTALGYKVVIVMPDSMSLERRALIRIFGARLILTPAKLGVKGCIAAAEKIFAETKDAYLTKQFETEFNTKIHRETTGPEIWAQTQGKVDIVIGGVGTGGTVTGIAQFLREVKAETKVIAVEPEESPVLSGGTHSPHKIQGIGAGMIPPIMDLSLMSEIVKVSSDESIATARRAALEEGLFVGISSGAALKAALNVAARPESKGKTIVVIIPSFGERYLSTALYSTLLEEVRTQKSEEPADVTA